jgi:predicted phage tail component-like protein
MAANSMTYDGVHLGALGVSVLDGSVSLSPEPRVGAKIVPGFAGGYAYGNGYNPRTLRARVLIEGQDEWSLVERMDALLGLLDPTKDAVVRFDNFRPDRYWLGRWNGGIDGDLAGYSHEFDLQFLCADAMAYAADETAQTVTLDASPKTFSVPTAGVLAGTAYAHPVYVYTHVGGSFGQIIVSNASSAVNGEALRWAGVLAVGHKLKIDTALWCVYKSVDAGVTWTDASYGIGDLVSGGASIFTRLANGIANAFTVTGPTNGTLSITYRARYK